MYPGRDYWRGVKQPCDRKVVGIVGSGENLSFCWGTVMGLGSAWLVWADWLHWEWRCPCAPRRAGVPAGSGSPGQGERCRGLGVAR